MAVRNNDSDTTYPIYDILQIVHFYKWFRLIVICLICSYFLGITWYIFVHDIFTTKWINPERKWEGVGDNPIDETFVYKYLTFDENYDGYKEYENYQICIRVVYFAITTLTTIGYGDLHPSTMNERILALPILLFGMQTTQEDSSRVVLQV